MKCPRCGVENAKGSSFCEACGAELTAQSIAEPDSQQASKPAGGLNDVLDKAKKLFNKNKKLVLAACAGVIVLILLISVIASVAGSGNGFIERESVLRTVENADGEIAVLSDTKLLSDKIASDFDEAGEPRTSLTGEVSAILDGEKTLYVINSKGVQKVDEDVYDYILSADGEGVAYLVDAGDVRALRVYNIGKKSKADVADDVRQYVISPDGKSIAYIVRKINEETGETTGTLYYYNGSDSKKIAGGDLAVLGISDGGKYIYAARRNDEGDAILYSYDKGGEDAKKIGALNSSHVYFNSDLTQVLYYGKEGKTYVSVKAGEPNKISSQTAMLLAPSNTIGSVTAGANGEICTVSTFYDHVYACDDILGYSVWYIRKNSDKSTKLVSKVGAPRLDESGEYLYYLTYDDELYVLQVSKGSSAKEKAVKLAEDVSKYVVTSDRKLVYYVSDKILYSVNGKKGGKSRQVYNDDVSGRLVLNSDDVVYFTSDGSLYACSNGKKSERVLDEVRDLESINGIVYASDGDALYVTDGSKKLKKVMDQ